MAPKRIIEELDQIFHPRSLALIGASPKPGKVSRMFMDRFLDTGFQTLYPLNPGADEVLGKMMLHSSLGILKRGRLL